MNIKKILIGFSIVYLIWHLYFLDKYPIIDLDDVWMTEPSWQLLKTGKFSAPMFEGIYNLEKSDIYHGRIFGFLQIPFLFLFGLGPYQARAASLFSGLLVLFLTFLLAKKLFDNQVAVLSTVLLSLSGLFILLSHRARQDMLLTLFILLTIYLFFLAREKNSNSLFFLTGLTAGLSLDVHLNGIIIPILLSIFFISELRSKKLYEMMNQFLFCFSGIFLGFFWWVYTHIFVNPDVFFNQWYGIVNNEFKAPILSGFSILHMIKKELTRYISWYWLATGHRNIIEFILLFSGIIFGIITKHENKKYPIITIITFLIMFTLIVAQKAPYYILFIYPFLIILFSLGVTTLIKDKNKAGLILPVALSFFYLSQLGYISYKYAGTNYNTFIKKVRQNISEDGKIFGDPFLWFEFPDRFYANFSFSYYQKVTGKNLFSFIEEKDIKYLVLDEDSIKKFGTDFSDLNCQKIATVEDKYFGSGGMLKSDITYYKTLIFKFEKSALRWTH